MTLLALLYDCCDVLNVIDILNSIAHSGRRALAMPMPHGACCDGSGTPGTSGWAAAGWSSLALLSLRFRGQEGLNFYSTDRDPAIVCVFGFGGLHFYR